MTTLTLYRGIAVKTGTEAKIENTIRNCGIEGTEGNLGFKIPDILDVRAHLADLMMDSTLHTDKIFKFTPFNGICACGTPQGAEYYALHHNFSAGMTPLLIEFNVTLDDMYVDCRDFMCPAFQLWDSRGTAGKAKQEKIMVELFGSSVLPYFENATRTKEQSLRIALGNLAAFDAEVVKAHYSNRKIIHGRQNTRFSSAFFVKAPVLASSIKSVTAPRRKNFPDPDVSLDEFQKLGTAGPA